MTTPPEEVPGDPVAAGAGVRVGDWGLAAQPGPHNEKLFHR